MGVGGGGGGVESWLMIIAIWCIALNTGFNLITCDLYFPTLVEVFTNHILAEKTYFTIHIEWTEHKIMVSKLASKYQIIWQWDNFKNILLYNIHLRYPPSSISLSSKSFVHIIFYGVDITNWKGETINLSNIYYLILLWCQKSIS